MSRVLSRLPGGHLGFHVAPQSPAPRCSRGNVLKRPRYPPVAALRSSMDPMMECRARNSRMRACPRPRRSAHAAGCRLRGRLHSAQRCAVVEILRNGQRAHPISFEEERQIRADWKAVARNSWYVLVGGAVVFAAVDLDQRPVLVVGNVGEPRTSCARRVREAGATRPLVPRADVVVTDAATTGAVGPP